MTWPFGSAEEVELAHIALGELLAQEGKLARRPTSGRHTDLGVLSGQAPESLEIVFLSLLFTRHGPGFLSRTALQCYTEAGMNVFVPPPSVLVEALNGKPPLLEMELDGVLGILAVL